MGNLSFHLKLFNLANISSNMHIYMLEILCIAMYYLDLEDEKNYGGHTYVMTDRLVAGFNSITVYHT